MDWDKLRIFHTVAEAGSFTHAGEILRLSQSAVSRQISTLEESLSVPLFHRHARGLILTEQGELLYRTAHDVFAKLAMTEAQLSENKNRPSGHLKVTATVAFGSTWLAPRITEFLELYPDIYVDLILADEELDLSMREADIAIRLSLPKQGDLVQRHLLTVNINAYASPEYIQQKGMPQTIDDLSQHRIITYGTATHPPSPGLNWLAQMQKKDGITSQSCFTVNNVYAILKAVESGAGIGALPEFVITPNCNLVRVLPDMRGPQTDAYFVYPYELRKTQRIEVFRDYLLKHVSVAVF